MRVCRGRCSRRRRHGGRAPGRGGSCRSRSSRRDDVLPARDEGAGRELEDLGPRDRRVEGEVEVLDRLGVLEAGTAQPHIELLRLAPFHLVGEEAGQSYWQTRAEQLGPEVGAYIREVFATDDVLAQLRTVQQMVRPLERFPVARARAACVRARQLPGVDVPPPASLAAPRFGASVSSAAWRTRRSRDLRTPERRSFF